MLQKSTLFISHHIKKQGEQTAKPRKQHCKSGCKGASVKSHIQLTDTDVDYESNADAALITIP